MRNFKWLNHLIIFIVAGITLTQLSCSRKIIYSDPSRVPADSQSQRSEDDTGLESSQGPSAFEEEALGSETAMERMQLTREDFINEDIYFEFDSAFLNPQSQETLNRKVAWLMDNPLTTIVIEGHCDDRGTNAYNLALGDRRAESAKTFLVDAGISASRIRTVSYGEERPAVSGDSEEARAKNRRAHFVIE